MNDTIKIPIDHCAPQHRGMTASVRLADGRRVQACDIDVDDTHAHFVPTGYDAPPTNAQSR
jgi:hypothetical protein